VPLPSMSATIAPPAWPMPSSEVVVPWFPYRPTTVLFGVVPGLMSKLSDRAVAKSPTFQAKMSDAPPEGE